jgi:DNA-binding MarR family transcriptional regulator
MSQLSVSDFADRLIDIMQVIGREFLRHETQEFYKMKITLPQFIVMDFLNRSGQTRMTDAARFLRVTTAAMTGIADRMVRDGYITRISDPQDRRIIKLKLTAKGDKIVKTAVEHRKRSIIKLFGMVSQKERDDYLNILGHIHSHLKEGA